MVNYPNPFNGETTIPFKLFYPANVKIDLYNLKGIKIAELMNEKLPAGDHNCFVILKSSDINLPSGNYAYQLTTESEMGKFMQVKVLTLE
jgi:hypothetical protein